MGYILDNQKTGTEKFRKVAVYCWFTASGKSMPQLVKYEDEEGMIQCIRNIHLIKTEEKNYTYTGIWTKRFDCCAEDEGIMRRFTLFYHIKDGTWDMVLGE